MITEQRYQYLLQGFLDRTLTEAELREFLASEHDQAFEDRIEAALKARTYTGASTVEDAERIFEQVLAGSDKSLVAEEPVVPETDKRVIRMRRVGWRVAAAAVVVLATGLTIYYQFLRPGATPATPPVAVTSKEITPGTNGAVLTLSDGRQVVLDSLGNGVVAQQQGAEAVLQDGRLVYDADKSASAAIVYNTMSTPKGRQFELTLPDGTKVWLNAASSIRYPTTFTGANRTVDVTGEVYLEVAADKAKPFFARINDSTRVAVLGTHFNVNAYANEQTINTTLLDGKVNVLSIAGTTPLRPGQQAQVQGGNTRVVAADVEQVMAWKNGRFDFTNASFEIIMRQLERWYDIEVVYENGIPDVSLMGKISRGVPLEGLLLNFERLGMRYKLEGRKLLVLND